MRRVPNSDLQTGEELTGGAKLGEVRTLAGAAAGERVDFCLVHELSREGGKGSAESGSSTRTASLRPTRPAAVLNRA